jgi:hypothetical protein
MFADVREGSDLSTHLPASLTASVRPNSPENRSVARVKTWVEKLGGQSRRLGGNRRFHIRKAEQTWRNVGRLTTLKVMKVKAPGMYADGAGLYLQVSGDGATRIAKSLIYRYTLNGRAHEMGLGPRAFAKRQRLGGVKGSLNALCPAGVNRIDALMLEPALFGGLSRASARPNDSASRIGFSGSTRRRSPPAGPTPARCRRSSSSRTGPGTPRRRRSSAMISCSNVCGLVVFSGSGVTDNLADKARKLGIPLFDFRKTSGA